MNSECNDILAELESWYARDNGQYLADTTRAAMQDLLDTSFGYHILQLGITAGRPLCYSSPINHRIYAADRAASNVALVAHADELPLDGDSIDTVIAHHCLEFTHNPHQVLRELQRVLTPQGQLLVVGFNPYSLLGINTYLRGLSRQSFWHQHSPVSENRLTDWLHLLGFEVQDVMRLYSVPPAGGGNVRHWLQRADAWSQRKNLATGGLYILHATKQVTAMQRPLRSRKERLIGLVPKPAPAPTPTPTPKNPIPQRRKPLGQGDVAA